MRIKKQNGFFQESTTNLFNYFGQSNHSGVGMGIFNNTVFTQNRTYL